MGKKTTPRMPSTPQTPSTPDRPPRKGRTKDAPTPSSAPADACEPGTEENDGPEIEGDSVFARAIGLTETALDDSLVVTDLLSNRSFRLNGVGVSIWRDLGARKPVDSVIRQLCEQWGLEVEEATQVVCNFASELLQANLIAQPDDEGST